jgi:hypothetical protein
MSLFKPFSIFIKIFILSSLYLLIQFQAPPILADSAELGIHSGASLWTIPVQVDRLKAKGLFVGGELNLSLGLSPKLNLLSKSHYAWSMMDQSIKIQDQQSWVWQGRLWQQLFILEYKPSDQMTPIIGLGLGLQRVNIDGWKEISVNGKPYQGVGLKESAQISPIFYINLGLEWRFMSQNALQFVLQSTYFQELSYGMFFNLSIYKYLDLF